MNEPIDLRYIEARRVLFDPARRSGTTWSGVHRRGRTGCLSPHRERGLGHDDCTAHHGRWPSHLTRRILAPTHDSTTSCRGRRLLPKTSGKWPRRARRSGLRLRLLWASTRLFRIDLELFRMPSPARLAKRRVKPVRFRRVLLGEPSGWSGTRRRADAMTPVSGAGLHGSLVMLMPRIRSRLLSSSPNTRFTTEYATGCEGRFGDKDAGETLSR